jgi:selenocysteine lyase/cysteine desulfurase
MKNYVNETKEYLRKSLNLSIDKKIIFTGSGTTCAINHLIYCLKLQQQKNTTNIFLTEFEHHSNYLPWIELQKTNKLIKIHIIKHLIDPITQNISLDLVFLENQIKATSDNTINIISITSASNVLGILFDTNAVYDLLQKYNNCSCIYSKKNLLFIDYACSAPYITIDGSKADALFMSPHKFLGGMSTPGILIADRSLFHNPTPFIPGGGCVKQVCNKVIEYEDDIEKKETAGTPNILGIVKIKKIFQLKKIFNKTIEINEHQITLYVFNKFNKLAELYKNLTILFPLSNLEKRLPIRCISIKNYHYNLIVKLLSDLFGIQTRGGVSCTGILADLIKTKYNINGWCRITFNWLMTSEEINFIIDKTEYIIKSIDQLSKLYIFDPKSNLFNKI